MKACPNCGTQVPDEGQFCPSCGAAVPAPEPSYEAPPAPAPAPEPSDQAPPAPPAPAAYPQTYAPPSAGVQPAPKKSRKGLIIGIVIGILVLLLGCCGAGALLFFNSDGTTSSGDKAKIETIETFAIGLGTLDFDEIRSVTTADVQDEIDAVEQAFASDGGEYATSSLLSSEWDGDTLVMSFEDADGLVSYIRIYPPTDGGTSLYTDDWDDTSTEADAIRTMFEVVDEDGWKVYTIDGETLDTYLGF